MKSLVLLLVSCFTLNAGYLKQITLSVNSPGNLVPSTQTNFLVPIMVGTFSYLKTVGNGGQIQNTTTLNSNTVPADLVFSTTACNSPTLIKWEVTKGYDVTTGAIQVWARIASLGTGVTTIYGCMNNTAVTTWQGDTTANTWSGMVSGYHLEDATSAASVIDQLGSNDLGETGVGTWTSTTGKLGQGMDVGAQFASYSKSSPSGFTGGTHGTAFSCWVNIPTGVDPSVQAPIIGIGTASNPGFLLDLVGSSVFGSVTMVVTDAQCCLRYKAFTPDSNWHLFHAVQPNGNTATTSWLLYIDGVSQTLTNSGSTTVNIGTGGMVLGVDPFSGSYWLANSANHSILDECHGWDSELSANWITTEYNSQNAPGTFTTIAGPTNVGGNPGGPWIIRVAKAREWVPVLIPSRNPVRVAVR